MTDKIDLTPHVEVGSLATTLSGQVDMASSSALVKVYLHMSPTEGEDWNTSMWPLLMMGPACPQGLPSLTVWANSGKWFGNDKPRREKTQPRVQNCPLSSVQSNQWTINPSFNASPQDNSAPCWIWSEQPSSPSAHKKKWNIKTSLSSFKTTLKEIELPLR